MAKGFPARDNTTGEPVEPTERGWPCSRQTPNGCWNCGGLSNLSWFMRCLCENWVETVRGFGRLFKQAAGRSSLLVDAAARCSSR